MKAVAVERRCMRKAPPRNTEDALPLANRTQSTLALAASPKSVVHSFVFKMVVVAHVVEKAVLKQRASNSNCLYT